VIEQSLLSHGFYVFWKELLYQVFHFAVRWVGVKCRLMSWGLFVRFWPRGTLQIKTKEYRCAWKQNFRCSWHYIRWRLYTASSIVACWTVFTELLPGNALIKSVTIPISGWWVTSQFQTRQPVFEYSISCLRYFREFKVSLSFIYLFRALLLYCIQSVHGSNLDMEYRQFWLRFF
jgi:hypothetical protein